jgi:exonuclease III
MNRLLPQVLLLASAFSALACQGPDSRSPNHATRSGMANPQPQSGLVAQFAFDGDGENSGDTSAEGTLAGTPSYSEGLQGRALKLGSDDESFSFSVLAETLPLRVDRDFSVQFWMRTDAESSRRFVLLSTKEFSENNVPAQRGSGWTFYTSFGTWAWTMGSGSRRITYERDNGSRMPLNDGLWHQLTMIYSSALGQVRLFYDGVNWVTYNVRDSGEFDFTSADPLTVGWEATGTQPQEGILPGIEEGVGQLQDLVDAFNALGLSEVQPEEFMRLVVEPRRLFEDKVDEAAAQSGADSTAFREAMEAVDWDPVSGAERALMSNPFTAHQSFYFMEVAPLSQIYSLVNGAIVVNEAVAEAFSARERLFEPEFEMDNLAVWDRVLDSEEVLASYAGFFEPAVPALEENISTLTAAAWNIYHGGKHFTAERDGWDSRVAIAEMLAAENADVIMMQETYSSGDLIAAELGYYLATTIDWDNLNQGANISVLSRYPIEEVYVEGSSTFHNVGTKVALSRTQDMYVMSNWYGMDQFPTVFDFHQTRFQESDVIPTLFAGDFNAIPHTDGGDSPASRTLLEAGFTDAFRSLYPDIQEFPGWSHRSDRRIDQLYYKGAGLKNTSTRVISTRPGGFPSDHFLLLSTFDLDYKTRGEGR